MSAFMMFHCILYDFMFLFEIKQISFPLWILFTLRNWKHWKLQTNFIQQLTVIRVFVQELQFTLIVCKPTCKITNTCKIIDVWYNWLALYRGTINSKLTIWSFYAWADGDMRVWHYNEVFYMERKRDLI